MEIRSEMFRIRISPTDRRVFALLAEAERRTVSDTLRELAYREAMRRGLVPLGRPAEERKQELEGVHDG